jgi:hypothetical protein
VPILEHVVQVTQVARGGTGGFFGVAPFVDVPIDAQAVALSPSL